MTERTLILKLFEFPECYNNSYVDTDGLNKLAELALVILLVGTRKQHCSDEGMPRRVLLVG
jgi:hypothetical protein